MSEKIVAARDNSQMPAGFDHFHRVGERVRKIKNVFERPAVQNEREFFSQLLADRLVQIVENRRAFVIRNVHCGNFLRAEKPKKITACFYSTEIF